MKDLNVTGGTFDDILNDVNDKIDRGDKFDVFCELDDT